MNVNKWSVGQSARVTVYKHYAVVGNTIFKQKGQLSNK